MSDGLENMDFRHCGATGQCKETVKQLRALEK